MDRRNFLGRASSALVVAGAWRLGDARLVAAAADESAVPSASTAPVVHLPAVDSSAESEIAFPVGQRMPFGLRALGLGPKERPTTVVVRWDGPAAERIQGHGARLRIRSAADFRDEKQVEATLAVSGTPLGAFDIRNPYPLQPFEIALSADQAKAAIVEGVRFRQTAGARPFWIACPVVGEAAAEPTFPPHLLVERPSDRLGEFTRRMTSLASLQEFGWMEGCVLDGLWHARGLLPSGAAAAAIELHLRRFLGPQGNLSYEGPQNLPGDNCVLNVETGLPFATLARVRPADDRLLTIFVDYCRNRLAVDGRMRPDHSQELYTAEGAYTLAYPLAAIARVRGDESLAEMAAGAAIARLDELAIGDDVWLRARGERRTYRNWARGFAWLLLGLARTMQELGDHASQPRLRAGFRRVAEGALRRQQASDGLWACFLGEPETKSECGGSAGIAAALAVGVREGWLGPECEAAARRARLGLHHHLTPDGFLAGVSQSNCCGEAFQRGGYRVIYPMAMGLLLQLEAALAG
jgi:hypothetical protein